MNPNRNQNFNITKFNVWKDRGWKRTLFSFFLSLLLCFYIGNSHSTHTTGNKTTGFGQVLGYTWPLPTHPWGTCFPYKELSGTNGSVVHSIYSFFQQALYKCLLHLKPRGQKDETAPLQELTGLKTEMQQLLDIPASSFVLQSPFLPKQSELFLKTYKSNHIPLLLKTVLCFPPYIKNRIHLLPYDLYKTWLLSCLSYHPNLQFYSNTNFSVLWTYQAHSCTGTLLILSELNNLSKINLWPKLVPSYHSDLESKVTFSDMASLKTCINRALLPLTCHTFYHPEMQG